VIFVDANVIIDVIGEDRHWFDWSFARLVEAASIGPVAISAIVVGEVAPRFGSLAAFVEEVAPMLIRFEPLTPDAAFRAGLAFQTYRQRRPAGEAKSLIADFLIGGHAMSLGATLLTRDPRFYSRYFPDLPLITPETHPHG
jgi:hypothetical protein